MALFSIMGTADSTIPDPFMKPFGRLCVMPMLTKVADRNPDLNLDISFTDRQVDLVEEGTDLAMRLGDPGDHRPDVLTSGLPGPKMTEPQSCSTPPASAIASGVSTSILAERPISTSVTSAIRASTMWRAPVSPSIVAT